MSVMAWFHIRPKVTKDFVGRTASYNEKYGNYDYANDSRILDTEFENKLLAAVGDIAGRRLLVVGSNSGYEINILTNHFSTAVFVAVDISDTALQKISENFPSIATTHADMEKLPFGDKEFDVYVNCRAIHSSNVDMEAALKEAMRVTKARIVLSISNGYLVEGKIVNGMYDYDKEKIDEEKPYHIAKSLKELLEGVGYTVEETNSKAELFLVGTAAQ